MDRKNHPIIILDCHGEIRPAICFSLEVAGYRIRVVTDENEAINLLENSRLTEERFSGLLVNNPYLNLDIAKMIEEMKRIGIDVPLIFVKDSEALGKIVGTLANEQGAGNVHHAAPTKVVKLLEGLLRSKSTNRGDAGSPGFYATQ